LDRALDEILAHAQTGSLVDSQKLEEQEELDSALNDMLARAQQHGCNEPIKHLEKQDERGWALEEILARTQQQSSGDDSKQSNEQEELDWALDKSCPMLNNKVPMIVVKN
jgi:gamma-glutamyl:cysteine ligase YbdK (ATP-grasp superfamily)